MPDTTIIVFTRWPQPGRAKTRLISALGADGAARLHERMTRQIVGRTWAHCLIGGHRLVIAQEGASARQMRSWLGPVEYVEQVGGDLGARLRAACDEAFRRGAKKAIVIGSDCPQLKSRHLAAAERALDDADAVFGPAEDGGYYLLGLRRSDLPIFEGIPWGTGGVLEASLRSLSAADRTVAQIDTLPDVDEPADLPDAEAALSQGGAISVIIPVWNEESNLDRLLPQLCRAMPHEIIVADGGSTDRSAAVAQAHGVRIVSAQRGRASQMNAAAAMASGEFLFFLHADTDPPEGWVAEIPKILECAGFSGGAFRFSLREPVPFGKVIEALVDWRCRLFSLPYGDQGLFVRRDVFQALGGYPEWPILEDVGLVRHLRRHGYIALSNRRIPSSSRRWKESGVLSVFLRHQSILFCHSLGVAPRSLANWRLNR